MKSGGLVVGAMVWLAAMVVAPPVVAGDLNPPGTPAPTMKTLDQIAPTWDQKIPDAAKRFRLVLDDQAVLDKETGLVWERWPFTGPNQWVDAIFNCFTLGKGARAGWRLPTIEELASLLDLTVSPGISLPAGHPFLSLQSTGYYWSATTHATNSANAWVVYLGGSMGSFEKTNNFYVWCVRGGRGNDGH